VSFDRINQYAQLPTEIRIISKKRSRLGVTKFSCDLESIFSFTLESAGDLSLFNPKFPG